MPITAPAPRVHMIRHGRPAGAWGGADADPGLDPEGHAQARAAADLLLSLPQPPVRVVSSPLRRCRETAAPLAAALGLPVNIDPRVGEIPTPFDLAAAERPAWLRAVFAGRWSGLGPDYAAWRAGVVEALVEHAGAAVFSHFVALNAAVSRATGSDAVHVAQPAHASVTTFEITPSGLALVSLGEQLPTEVL